MRCYETRCANNDGEGYCEIDTSITIEQGGQCSNMWIPSLYPPKTDKTKQFIQNQIQEHIYNAFAMQEPETLMDKDMDFYRKMKSLERRMTNVD